MLSEAVHAEVQREALDLRGELGLVVGEESVGEVFEAGVIEAQVEQAELKLGDVFDLAD